MEEMTRRLSAALDALGDGLLLVVTGAGISRASGIPTFRGRDPKAIWKVSDFEMATWGYFQRDPVGQWSWYLSRFESVDGAVPNAGHRALVELEQWQTERGGAFLLVTQNIDTLHERAGSQSLIKVHGTSDRVRCSRQGCSEAAPLGSIPRDQVDLTPFEQRQSEETLPRCPVCDGYLRAHVLFFDEYYHDHRDYRFDEVQGAAATADLVLFVGTSFSVGVTDLFLQAARARGVPAFSIDPQAAPIPSGARLDALEAPAEEILPAVCRRLLAGAR